MLALSRVSSVVETSCKWMLCSSSNLVFGDRWVESGSRIYNTLGPEFSHAIISSGGVVVIGDPRRHFIPIDNETSRDPGSSFV